MENTTANVIILAVISYFQPNFIALFDSLFNKIINEKTRKSVIFLCTVILGFVLAYLSNIIFKFNLPLLEVFFLGTGIQVIGQAGYRVQKNGNTNGNQ